MRGLAVVLFVTLFISCDCFRSYQGVVLDAETGEPIEGVQIYNSSSQKDLRAVSTSNGTYQGTVITGWLACRKSLEFYFTKDGYKDTVAIDSGKVLMTKLEK